ncbi:UNVERIFIED_CONTAM: hypothetical protein Slati_3828200 [Sesamum latifolium]|uniref:Cytoplasmic dynein 2 light intermediate chain 1 n=1 Tax=Sesamum latifolium TaxID=2727402 RepID=A0AAW2TKV7_9LAMI
MHSARENACENALGSSFPVFRFLALRCSMFLGFNIFDFDSYRVINELSSSVNMHGVRRGLAYFCKNLHTLSRDGPSDTLKRKVAELEKKRKKRNPKKNQLLVDVPESRSFLDTATMPMLLTVVGIALFAKLLMMHDEATSQERIERKIKNAPAGQGTVRMLTREEWDEIQEVRPRTPFESKLSRPNARIRTGEPLHLEDVKDWTVDVLTDALTRAEETARRGSN